MRYEPFVAVAPAPDLGGGDHEQAPGGELAAGLAPARDPLEQRERLLGVGVQALEPGAGT
jgi:hypothetical protein